jgi:hypothetical protein
LAHPVRARRLLLSAAGHARGKAQRFELVRLVESGEEVTYEMTKPDGSRGRNTDMLTFKGDRIGWAEVYLRLTSNYFQTRTSSIHDGASGRSLGVKRSGPGWFSAADVASRGGRRGG